MNDFKNIVRVGEQNTIAVDFDGVLHNPNKGFHDGTIYGEIIKDAKKSIRCLFDSDWDLVIFTCKANPMRPLINGKTGVQLIWDWLVEHNLDEFISDVVWGKPNAKYYIDDRGIYFNSWEEVIKKI